MIQFKQLGVTSILVFGTLFSIAQKASNNIAILLPFCAKLTLENPNHSNIQLSNLSREYYQGALIASDSLSKLGSVFHVSIFDTENDSNITVGLLKKSQIKEADLILGPIMQGGNKVLSDFIKDKDVFHVSPLMTLSKTKFSDPDLMSPNPNLTNYPNLILKHYQTIAEPLTIIIVSDKSTLDKTITASFKQLQQKQKQLKIKVVDYSSSLDLKSELSHTKPNCLVVPSSNENIVNAILKNIKDTSVYSNMIVYGFPQWLDFKNPNYQLWEAIHVRIASPFFIDYQHLAVKKFIEAYRERFYTEPSEAAFKGYDQLLYFSTNLDRYGKKMLNNIVDKPQELLHTTYEFKKLDDKSGYQNMFLNFIGVENLAFRRY